MLPEIGATELLVIAAVALIVAIANFTWKIGDMSFEGIALGTGAALLIYHGMRLISKVRVLKLLTCVTTSQVCGITGR